jgi:peptide deformylase
LIWPILYLPDPVLREVCAPVLVFSADLRSLAGDMLDTMYDAPGRGLAAPQIGVRRRVFVMDTDWKDGAPNPMVFVNPEIVGQSGALKTFEEGCLSIPGRKVMVERPAEVTLRWYDLDGTMQKQWFDGFPAACVQHELDHLDGRLCIDYPVPE